MRYLAASLRATLLPALVVGWLGFLSGCDKLYETRIVVDGTGHAPDQMADVIHDALEQTANDAGMQLERRESDDASTSYGLRSRRTGRSVHLIVDRLSGNRWEVKIRFFGPGFSRSYEPEPGVVRFEEAVIPELEDIVGPDNVSVTRDWR